MALWWRAQRQQMFEVAELLLIKFNRAEDELCTSGALKLAKRPIATTRYQRNDGLGHVVNL